ncbi:hypothetical protein LLS1_34540 [Leifsonia sp. LS1]|uniref:cation:proton antiporter n=1 Tax=Leifsonia sp. LS1 TaxID=2828483 RepID=UPI001CFE7328|nr:cation:proton antiporter [Leifsonia sp. LS1]GIT81785.1 hypothetical protein LLS1_34540 [Leifsonia sp. LS1]
MSFSLLALVVAVGLLGPIVSLRAGWRVPVAVGELLGGLLLGTSGLRLIDPRAGGLDLLATIGFGLTMVVVGSQIPVRDVLAPGPARRSLARGVLAATAVGVAAAGIAAVVAVVFRSPHGLLYGVLLASSSAALVLPMLGSVGRGAPSTGELVAQVAFADLVCVVALPAVIAPERAPEAALAIVVVAAASAMLGYLAIRLGRKGRRGRLHAYSERRRFALELRLSLLVLFGFAAIAEYAGLSIMIAGFALGLVLSAIGEPRRLARQLFGMTEGFFAPLFFVWLGASIDLRSVGAHPMMIVLGIVLGGGAVVAHLASRLTGLSWALAAATAGQLGVPVAAVTLGLHSHVLAPGEDGAILLGAVLTIAVSAFAVRAESRREHARRRRSPSTHYHGGSGDRLRPGS